MSPVRDGSWDAKRVKPIIWEVDRVASGVLRAAGYGDDTKVYDQSGRPHFIVQGRPVLKLF